MEYVNFKELQRGRRLSLLFPGWKKGEKVAFYSSHDDDALLGAGYLIASTVKAGGIPHLFIFCRGDAGYSTPQEKKGIVARRRKEAIRAYGMIGVPEKNIHFFDIPDFSLMGRMDRRLIAGNGVFDQIIGLLRREQISRVVFSSGDREHWDHTAVFYAGVYTSPQAQDPILVDLGKPSPPIKSYLAYSVWGDFEPSPVAKTNLPADLGILATDRDEEIIIAAIKTFSSQARIIKSIVAHRQRRKSKDGYLELYKSITVRQPIDFAPYFRLLKRMNKN